MTDSLRCFAHIDLGRLRQNVEVLRRHAGEKQLLAVVKADAYGHGAPSVARAIEDRVTMFGVSTMQEALELRDVGIHADILLQGYAPCEALYKLAKNNVTITIYDANYAKEQSRIAKEGGFRLRCHLKLNSGMNRLGIACERRDDILTTLSLENLDFEGVFTHFASADGRTSDDCDFTSLQQERFLSAVEFIKSNGHKMRFVHSENTAGTIFCDIEGCNMVRCGIGLYGFTTDLQPLEGLRPVMRFFATVAQLQYIDDGDSVSYGRTFTAKEQMKVAVLTVGYADGYPRALSGRGMVSFNGESAKVVGRVCMDYIIVDVSHIENVAIGDKVEVIGDAPASDAVSTAEMCDTIVYEVLCGVSSRVVRIYDPI